MKQFVVIGLGRFGSSIAKALSIKKIDVLAIDRDEARVREMEGIVGQTVVLDATDEKALKELGVADFDTAIVSMGETIEDSIMITLSLKELGVQQVIVKAQSELHAKILKKVGADRIIFPEREMAERLAESLASPKIFDFIELSDAYGIIEMVLPKRLIDKTLAQVKLREKYAVSVIAIKRKVPYTKDDGATDFRDEILIGPGGNDEIIAGDVLIIMGKNEDLAKIQKI
ncbi:potassium uptake system protein [candidate division WOR-3 bacterium RBG_13_43_14]|uniref:Potassium uptake system protein n=1 Tax=candidate division WOR-3 bacterium RBG_13_43_14 TaxID=1802590 RepID=A0A1F4UCH1_UNCW3|nr:MAG: potassium uptake system protein [candidate division WOR-3 bacterium RBG_13_43_14]